MSLPSIRVVCPTRTPGTSVIALRSPAGSAPGTMPRSRARARLTALPARLRGPARLPIPPSLAPPSLIARSSPSPPLLTPGAAAPGPEERDPAAVGRDLERPRHARREPLCPGQLGWEAVDHELGPLGRSGRR